MKKILFIIMIVIATFIIYMKYNHQQSLYLVLGDNTYIENESLINLSDNNNRLMDITNSIRYNNKYTYNNSTYNIQNLLVKSNKIIISIGMNDISSFSNNSIDNIYNLIEDYNNLLKIIKKITKEDIYVLSFYNDINNKQLIEYANKELKRICKENKVKYIDISYLNLYIDNNKLSNEGIEYLNKKLNFTKKVK